MRKVIKMGLMAVAFMFVLTVAMTVINREDAKAGLFDDVSMKKCDVRLEKDVYDWTGREVRPRVFVSYKGQNLRENMDYTLTYKNNVDAGVGEVKVKGIGGYRSSVTLEFTIWGIDITRECTFRVIGGEIEVYYKDRVVSTNNYKVKSIKTSEKLVSCRPSHDPKYNECVYEVKETYKIEGKGQYYGTYEHVHRYTETRREKNDNKPQDPKPQPEQPVKPDEPNYPGGPGHNPGPGGPGHNPGPGGPGHNPGPGGPGHNPGPGGPGHNPGPGRP